MNAVETDWITGAESLFETSGLVDPALTVTFDICAPLGATEKAAEGVAPEIAPRELRVAPEPALATTTFGAADEGNDQSAPKTAFCEGS
ncbi:hypothetical protein JCM15831A_02690 [Asaia astilbis]